MLLDKYDMVLFWTSVVAKWDFGCCGFDFLSVVLRLLLVAVLYGGGYIVPLDVSLDDSLVARASWLFS